MTISERVRSYNGSTWGVRYPASRLWVQQERGRDVLYGFWLIGNDYRATTPIYGSYPPHYLDRMAAIFPDIGGRDGRREILHAFSGGLGPGEYTRCDVNPARGADIVADVLDLPGRWDGPTWRLVYADPPYSAEHATRYGVKMINRIAVTNALAEIVVPDGFLVWLDQLWPMHRAVEWETVGRISIITSTNRIPRLVSIFRRRRVTDFVEPWEATR